MGYKFSKINLASNSWETINVLKDRLIHVQNSGVTSLSEFMMEPRPVAGWPFGQGKLQSIKYKFYIGPTV